MAGDLILLMPMAIKMMRTKIGLSVVGGFYFPDFGITALYDLKTKGMGISGIGQRQAMTWDKALIQPHSRCITTIFRVVIKVMLSFHMAMNTMTTTEVMSPLSILADAWQLC